MRSLFGGKLIVKTGDITKERVDAIVNAANSSLLGGGGVDGAIHCTGGPQILTECKQLRETHYPQGMPAGLAISTTAGNLAARFVIHTVGPIWYGGKNHEDDTLRNAYLNSLQLAASLNCVSISIPAISTGIYHFPKDRAARIVYNVIEEFLHSPTSIKVVNLLFFNQEDEQIFLSANKL